jgi:hypothetical protein
MYVCKLTNASEEFVASIFLRKVGKYIPKYMTSCPSGLGFFRTAEIYGAHSTGPFSSTCKWHANISVHSSTYLLLCVPIRVV